MNSCNPIYTERTECQDCCKCIRECPVKAIKVQGGFASIIAELCVLCGHCVEVCPHGAKKVRDDLSKAKSLLKSGKQIFASVAPSFVSDFPALSPGKLIGAIKRLGFSGVSETAIGAELVSSHISNLLKEEERRILISSACPSVVEYLRKYRPILSNNITGLLSPLLTHCRMLKEAYSNEIGIVFFGPCISKKREADLHPELLDVALTFEDLRDWFKDASIRLDEEMEESTFITEHAKDGALYPIEGGMLRSIKTKRDIDDNQLMCFSGIQNIEKALSDLNEIRPEKSLFLELLACEGGCVNGPKAEHRAATISKRCNVLKYAQPAVDNNQTPQLNIKENYPPQPIPHDLFNEAKIKEALRAVGKSSIEDELNCGGCGYDSCREFAKAFINGKAERTMCVTYMRKLAQKKANALMNKMPSAVVIVGKDLRIIECNPSFIKMFSDEGTKGNELGNSFEGMEIDQVVPFHSMFEKVLETDLDMLEKDIRYRGRILHVSIFTIEEYSVVGGIVEDITQPSIQREEVIKRARKVIKQSLTTVQQIAYLIGENAAESEIILNSIVESFSPTDEEEHDE